MTITMILGTIKMEAPSDKRMELLQVITSLVGSIRTQKGCRWRDLGQNVNDENRLLLLDPVEVGAYQSAPGSDETSQKIL